MQRWNDGLEGPKGGESGYMTMQIGMVRKVEGMRQTMVRAADEALHATTNQIDEDGGQQGKCE